jgi:hypothetical protein
MNLQGIKYINVVTGHREIISSFKTLIREFSTGYKYYVVSHFFLDIETNEVVHEHEVCINWAKTSKVLFGGTARECIDYINSLPA